MISPISGATTKLHVMPSAKVRPTNCNSDCANLQCHPSALNSNQRKQSNSSTSSSNATTSNSISNHNLNQFINQNNIINQNINQNNNQNIKQNNIININQNSLIENSFNQSNVNQNNIIQNNFSQSNFNQNSLNQINENSNNLNQNNLNQNNLNQNILNQNNIKRDCSLQNCCSQSFKNNLTQNDSKHKICSKTNSNEISISSSNDSDDFKLTNKTINSKLIHNKSSCNKNCCNRSNCFNSLNQQRNLTNKFSKSSESSTTLNNIFSNNSICSCCPQVNNLSAYEPELKSNVNNNFVDQCFTNKNDNNYNGPIVLNKNNHQKNHHRSNQILFKACQNKIEIDNLVNSSIQESNCFVNDCCSVLHVPSSTNSYTNNKKIKTINQNDSNNLINIHQSNNLMNNHYSNNKINSVNCFDCKINNTDSCCVKYDKQKLKKKVNELGHKNLKKSENDSNMPTNQKSLYNYSEQNIYNKKYCDKLIEKCNEKYKDRFDTKYDDKLLIKYEKNSEKYYKDKQMKFIDKQLSPYEKVLASLRKKEKQNRETNSTIGLYQIRNEIGNGNFSKVFIGKHLLTKDEVAIKVLKKSKLDTKTQKMLLREISAMDQLHHPNVVRLFEVIETLEKFYLVMEYAHGGELYQKINQEGRLSENKASYYFAQIISAVDHLHSHRIIHRDIKAENIFFADKTFTIVKIGDFGFANQLISNNQLLNTFCGSPPYASPELFKNQSYQGQSVDLWALGVLLYFMVTGLMPFNAQTVTELKNIILIGDYYMPEHVSENCKYVINGLLSHLPQNRFSITNIKQSKFLQLRVFNDPLPSYHLKKQKIPSDDSNNSEVNSNSALQIVSTNDCCKYAIRPIKENENFNKNKILNSDKINSSLLNLKQIKQQQFLNNPQNLKNENKNSSTNLSFQDDSGHFEEHIHLKNSIQDFNKLPQYKIINSICKSNDNLKSEEKFISFFSQDSSCFENPEDSGVFKSENSPKISFKSIEDLRDSEEQDIKESINRSFLTDYDQISNHLKTNQYLATKSKTNKEYNNSTLINNKDNLKYKSKEKDNSIFSIHRFQNNKLSLDEQETLIRLKNYGINEQMLKESLENGIRNSLIGIYRLVLHNVIKSKFKKQNEIYLEEKQKLTYQTFNFDKYNEETIQNQFNNNKLCKSDKQFPPKKNDIEIQNSLHQNNYPLIGFKKQSNFNKKVDSNKICPETKSKNKENNFNDSKKNFLNKSVMLDKLSNEVYCHQSQKLNFSVENLSSLMIKNGNQTKELKLNSKNKNNDSFDDHNFLENEKSKDGCVSDEFKNKILLINKNIEDKSIVNNLENCINKEENIKELNLNNLDHKNFNLVKENTSVIMKPDNLEQGLSIVNNLNTDVEFLNKLNTTMNLKNNLHTPFKPYLNNYLEEEKRWKKMQKKKKKLKKRSIVSCCIF